MFDSHAHLCFPDFSQDQEEVIAKAKKEIKGVLVSSARFEEGKQVLSLIQKHPHFLFASLGYHPVEGNELEKTIDLIRKNNQSITAIGEVGLDFHWEKNKEKHEIQKQSFSKFISLAKEIKKPLVIHSWEAEREAFDMVKNEGIPAAFHCFTGKKDLALEIAKAGFYVSISTVVFFSKDVKKTAKAIPLDKLLLETDSPFLDPNRERKHNTPDNIRLSAKKIAELRGISQEEVEKAAWENAKKLFKISCG